MKIKILSQNTFLLLIISSSLFSYNCSFRTEDSSDKSFIKEKDMTNRNKQFADVIDKAIVIAEDRLAQYDSSKKEFLTREQLKILLDNLKKDKEEVLTGEIEAYQGQLFGPIKPVIDWGEPDNSDLRKSLHDIEIFYRQNY